MNNKIIFKIQQRPCMVYCEKDKDFTTQGLFFGISYVSDKAIVELKTGQIKHFELQAIRLLDSNQNFRETVFPVLK